jgi:Tol biopolymer transport system component
MARFFELVSKIAITSSRDHDLSGIPVLNNQGEIYLIDPDGKDLQAGERLTDNAYMDALPMLSPDGKKIVFDSNRLTFDSFSTLRTSGHQPYPTCLLWMPTAQISHC